jgi:CheY-like chemotaxis protein
MGGKQLSILLVENHIGVLCLLRDMLQSKGYNALASTSGIEAISLCRDPAVSIDLVLAEVLLSDMNGFDLANHVRNSRPQVPILLMSASPQRLVSEHRDLSTIEAFIEKPFLHSVLLTRITRALEQQSPCPSET